MTTLDRLLAHMNDPHHQKLKLPKYIHDRGFDYWCVRQPFVTSNGYELSIQQSASHYCSRKDNQYELGYVPHSELLAPYGDGEYSPVYGFVPEEVVVAYIDEIEARKPNNQE